MGELSSYVRRTPESFNASSGVRTTVAPVPSEPYLGDIISMERVEDLWRVAWVTDTEDELRESQFMVLESEGAMEDFLLWPVEC